MEASEKLSFLRRWDSGIWNCPDKEKEKRKHCCACLGVLQDVRCKNKSVCVYVHR